MGSITLHLDSTKEQSKGAHLSIVKSLLARSEKIILKLNEGKIKKMIIQVYGARFDSMEFVNYESFMRRFVEDRESKF